MAKKAKRRHFHFTRRNYSHKKTFTVPLAVVAGFAPLAINTWAATQNGGGLSRAGWMVTQALTGYDTDTNKWWWPNMKKGLIPIVIGFAAHKAASMFGINRALGRAGIPFIRI